MMNMDQAKANNQYMKERMNSTPTYATHPELTAGSDFLSLKRTNADQLVVAQRAGLGFYNTEVNNCGFSDFALSTFFTIVCVVCLYLWVTSDEGFPKMFAIPFLVTYILLQQCFMGAGRVCQAFEHKTTKADVNATIQTVKAKPVHISINVCCSHTVTKTSGNSTNDQNNSQTETIVTYEETIPIKYKSCLDLGKSKVDFGKFHCCLVNSTLEVVAGEKHKEDYLEKMKSDLYEANKHRDTNCNVHINYSIEGFHNTQSIMEQNSCLINRCYMSLSNFLLLAPLWYLWFYKIAAGEVTFRHQKVIYFESNISGGIQLDGETV